MTEAERYAVTGAPPRGRLLEQIEKTRARSIEIRDGFDLALRRGAVAPPGWPKGREWIGLSQDEHDELMTTHTLAYSFLEFRDGSKIEIRFANAAQADGGKPTLTPVDFAGRPLPSS